MTFSGAHVAIDGPMHGGLQYRCVGQLANYIVPLKYDGIEFTT